jgi:hypothetical protein
MSVTLNLKPEVEAGLAAHARATGMTLEGYVERLVEQDFSLDAAGPVQREESGMVWENGLLIYGAGSELPSGFIENAVQRSRADR